MSLAFFPLCLPSQSKLLCVSRHLFLQKIDYSDENNNDQTLAACSQSRWMHLNDVIKPSVITAQSKLLFLTTHHQFLVCAKNNCISMCLYIVSVGFIKARSICSAVIRLSIWPQTVATLLPLATSQKHHTSIWCVHLCARAGSLH